MIQEKHETAFAVDDTQRNNNGQNYIQCLFAFIHAFYKELAMIQEMKTEMISRILTLSDKLFMLLCIKVYFGNNTDLIIEQGDDVKRYVIKTGWQELGITMYNVLHNTVFINYQQYNNQFNEAFYTFITEFQKPNPEK